MRELRVAAARGSTRRSKAASPVLQAPRLRLSLARLPARMREALRVFRKVTGFSAVMSVANAVADDGEPRRLLPPVHPRCRALVRMLHEVPCGAQWNRHVRTGIRTRRAHIHTCPLAQRCACVPVFFGDALVGVAKLVVSPETPRAQFAAATQALELAVARYSQDGYQECLALELTDLRRRATRMASALSNDRRPDDTRAPRTATTAGETTGVCNGSLVSHALAYLDRHYGDPALSVRGMARALGCSEKYLSHHFTMVVGQRMHVYLVALRVQQACDLLLGTSLLIKQVALTSGFRTAKHFSRAFRGQIGVRPQDYRRLFQGRDA